MKQYRSNDNQVIVRGSGNYASDEAKEILPIRPNRQNERKVKAKSPVSFNYRYD